jgi:hypothetical protein
MRCCVQDHDRYRMYSNGDHSGIRSEALLMGNTTPEQEIVSCLKENLKGAADDCDMLVRLPAQGPTFVRLRERLKTVENCCRQVAHWREDTRWLPVGIMMEMVHQKSREWIVGHMPRPLFRKLGENLRMLEKAAEGLETRATGRMGMILPDVQAAPMRASGRPVQVLAPMERRTAGGIILPS